MHMHVQQSIYVHIYTIYQLRKCTQSKGIFHPPRSRLISDWSAVLFWIQVCITSAYSLCFVWRIPITICRLSTSSLIIPSIFPNRTIGSASRKSENLENCQKKSISKLMNQQTMKHYQGSYWPSADDFPCQAWPMFSILALSDSIESSKYFINSPVEEWRWERCSLIDLVDASKPMTRHYDNKNMSYMTKSQSLWTSLITKKGNFTANRWSINPKTIVLSLYYLNRTSQDISISLKWIV